MHKGHITGWQFRGSQIDHFTVEISNADGWRFYLYHGRGTYERELVQSEPFATDLLAAMGGIERAEMLMANQQWAASQCEAEAENHAAWEAEKLAEDIRFTAKRARELGREDIAVAVETRQLDYHRAWDVLRPLKFEQAHQPTAQQEV